MSDDYGRTAVEAAHGSWRLAAPHFEHTHRELFGEDAAVSQQTAQRVVEKMKGDPDLAPMFKRPRPRWEDLRTMKDKSEFIDEHGVDAFLSIARQAHMEG